LSGTTEADVFLDANQTRTSSNGMGTASADDSYLGSRLLCEGLINSDDLRKAMVIKQRTGGKIGPILIRIGALSEENLLRILSDTFGLPLLDTGDLKVDPEAFHSIVGKSGIDPDWWLDQEVFVWDGPNGSLGCVARDPVGNGIEEILHRCFPAREIQFFLARSYDLDRILESLSRSANRRTFSDSVDHLKELAEEAPVIEFVNNLFSRAFEQRSSDVHIEPGEHALEVRFRTDGVLHSQFILPKERYPAISSRLKLISGMDIAERRLPQDGRLGLRLSGEEVDIRVSTLPGVHGESVVLRLLPKESKGFDLEGLGFESDYLLMLQNWIAQPHGIILVTGPTGSGKSTTLYAVLEAINDRKKKIITVEDPVEYQIDGIHQTQAHAEIGLTFARALRSILRQDPDVILIGEIRDRETAEIAIQASLTGHLVLSTLHTNDAISSFTRLIDMGVEPFLVATPVRGVLAQRLVRRLCPHCSIPSEPVKEIIEVTNTILPDALKAWPANWRVAAGCPKCQSTGYRGREGIFEMVPVTAAIQHCILTGKSTMEMRELSRNDGCRNLREDGLLKAWRGVTSIEEVLRVTAE